MLTLMRDTQEIVYHVTLWNNIKMINDYDDNVMRVSVWFDFSSELF